MSGPGSLMGLVASERVSEALKVPSEWLEPFEECKGRRGALTATPTGGAGTKVGLSGSGGIK